MGIIPFNDWELTHLIATHWISYYRTNQLERTYPHYHIATSPGAIGWFQLEGFEIRRDWWGKGYRLPHLPNAWIRMDKRDLVKARAQVKVEWVCSSRAARFRHSHPLSLGKRAMTIKNYQSRRDVPQDCRTIRCISAHVISNRKIQLAVWNYGSNQKVDQLRCVDKVRPDYNSSSISALKYQP